MRTSRLYPWIAIALFIASFLLYLQCYQRKIDESSELFDSIDVNARVISVSSAHDLFVITLDGYSTTFYCSLRTRDQIEAFGKWIAPGDTLQEMAHSDSIVIIKSGVRKVFLLAGRKR